MVPILGHLRGRSMTGEKKSLPSSPITFATTAVSIALGYYSGWNFMLPAVGAGLVLLAISQTHIKDDEIFAIAICALGGHFLWMIAAAVIILSEGGNTPVIW